jgi:dUTP pyrophosphatase
MFSEINNKLKVKCILQKGGCLPSYKTTGSSCMDIYSSGEYMLKSKEITLINTSLFLEIPMGYEGQIRSRSGLAMQGICVFNSPGTIDSDYRGEIKVLLFNASQENFCVKPGDRIAQIQIVKVLNVQWQLEESLSDTFRGHGGFGSTRI